MQINVPFKAIGSTGFNLRGGTLTSPLILVGNPTLDLEATPKQYVDSKISSINADGLNSGILNKGLFPSYTGDVTSAQGSGSFYLSTTGVNSGSYTKIIIDNSGRVVSFSSLSNTDIPDLDWSKVDVDMPESVTAFGITDVLSKVGGAVTGYITTSVAGATSLDAVTKDYVDSLEVIFQANEVVVGDIFERPSEVTPTGFLRCNGSDVSKTTYAALYAVIGGGYALEMTPGSGKPWEQQYYINSSQVNDIGDWTTVTSLPVTMEGSKAIVTKNRVYLIGGSNNGTASSAVYTALINPDGTLGAWTTSESLPEVVYIHEIFVTKNRVYVINAYQNKKIYTAVINNDGTLGSWEFAPDFPIRVNAVFVLLTTNKVYVIGGDNPDLNLENVSESRIWEAVVDSDGVLGNWTLHANSLPSPVRWGSLAVVKNRVYLIGGANHTTPLSSVYMAFVDSQGTLGSWSEVDSLPSVVSASCVVTTYNTVYILCYNGTTGYRATINADGSLGAWTAGVSTPVSLSSSSVAIVNNKLYLFGGFASGTSWVSTVYSASFLGGVNDYSSYYDGSLIPTNANLFKLPDYTSLETSVSKYYIKY